MALPARRSAIHRVASGLQSLHDLTGNAPRQRLPGMQLPTSADNTIDQDLEDTFPASDPTAHATPSERARSDAGRDVSDTAWIDLYRIEIPNDGATDASFGTTTDFAQHGELRFSPAPALARLQYLVDAPSGASRVCLVSARAESTEAGTPLDEDAHAQRSGQLFPSELSPADREVFWNAGRPGGGALCIVARTVFDPEPRLQVLLANAQASQQG